ADAAAEPLGRWVPRSPPSADLVSGPLRVADALAAFVDADADAAGFVVFGVEQHHVGDVDRTLLLDDAAGLGVFQVALRARSFVALDHVQALDEDAALFRIGADDAAFLAGVLAADQQDRVVGADAHRLRHQRTSGASEMIFMKLRSRSSRATGPKMRVPRGLLLAGSISTAAFSSKEM